MRFLAIINYYSGIVAGKDQLKSSAQYRVAKEKSVLSFLFTMPCVKQGMTEKTVSPETPLDFRAVREEHLKELRAKGIEPFAPASINITASAAALKEKYAHLADGERTEDNVTVVGRLIGNRNSGMFLDIQDDTDRLQIFCDKKELAQDIWDIINLLDLGDHVAVTGLVRRTPRGEITVNLAELKIIGKAMIPPPEKYHGLTDVDTRYRHREQDLVGNSESRDNLRKRFLLIRAMRNFLESRDFLEVETPMLHVIPGGANAKPFVTHHNTLDMPLYLRVAPELHLKRLIVGGLARKVFEINRCFRNEGLSIKHNPEFTSMESYEAYTDYHGVMTLAEDVIAHCALTVNGNDTVTMGDNELVLKAPFPRRSMCELVKEQTGIDFLALDLAGAQKAARDLRIEVKDSDRWGDIVANVFDEKVEHTLIQPVHVTDLPKDISPLAQGHRSDDRLTERFETYMNGWELANGFSELSDPFEQRARFAAQETQREAGDDEAQKLDEDFIKALELGLPPTGGLGIGIDRLAMILTGTDTIREVIAFPTMRPK